MRKISKKCEHLRTRPEVGIVIVKGCDMVWVIPYCMGCRKQLVTHAEDFYTPENPPPKYPISKSFFRRGHSDPQLYGDIFYSQKYKRIFRAGDKMPKIKNYFGR